MCFLDVPVASWFISPLLSGLMSGFLFLLIRHFILNKVGKYFLTSVSLNPLFFFSLWFDNILATKEFWPNKSKQWKPSVLLVHDLANKLLNSPHVQWNVHVSSNLKSKHGLSSTPYLSRELHADKALLIWQQQQICYVRGRLVRSSREVLQSTQRSLLGWRNRPVELLHRLQEELVASPAVYLL